MIDQETATDLSDALELMSYRRLHHQVAQARAGQPPDNHLAPRLDEERRHFGLPRYGAHLSPVRRR